MTTIRLDGCTSQPLLSYLAALGVLAATSEQLDARITGWWQHGRFHLDTPDDLGIDELVEFLATGYSPPPIISPWNSRGGFRLDRTQTSEKRLREMEASTDPRLEPYRRAIDAGRQVLVEAESLGLANDGNIDGARKAEFIRLCRSRLPDEVLGWIDAAVVLVDDDARYPELLGGSGGNLGSGDLSSNAHEAALWLVGVRDARPFAREALTGVGAPKLKRLLVGQFHPAGAGGVNMGSSDSIVNPLAFLLALHGATLFAAGVARRLDGARVPTVPFTVRVDPGTEPVLAEGEQVRAELWLPEWRRPLTLPELRALLAEGRAQWQGSQSSRTLDFARAAASLGVDRDITAFSRYVVAQRHGQAMLAVPVGRFQVGRRREVELTAAIDTPFLDSVRSISNPSNEVRRAANQLRRHMFVLAEQGGAEAARRVLAALFDLERAIGRSKSAQESVLAPVRGLLARDWLELLADDSAEFGLACAIASQRDRVKPDRARLDRQAGSMAVLCRPIERDGMRRRRESEAVDNMVWSGRPPVVDLLGADVRRELRSGWQFRATRAAQHPAETQADDVTRTPGIEVAFDFSLPCSLDDAIAFGLGETDDVLLGEWLRALVMLDWSAPTHHLTEPRTSEDSPATLGPAFCAIAPFFHRDRVRIDIGDTSGVATSREVRFNPTSVLVAAVARGDTATAVREASRRLRQYGVETPAGRWVDSDPRPLDAALVPVRSTDLGRIVRAIDPQSFDRDRDQRPDDTHHHDLEETA